ncbi:MAG: oxygen-independent coproporphyrinogen III oxidase [bacterium]|jgi:oxygen-independent coproporphyrinogen-3 oxidase|nr:oxygen-independent coproporphyrinogen III oxidase [bacterium]
MNVKPRKITIDHDLIQKYTMRGPRYTSYPTAPEWDESVGGTHLRAHIEATNAPDSKAPLSIYIHIPFCAERCYYCGCNVIISPQQDIGDRYVDHLIKEIDLVAPSINPQRKVTQFHFGGGTPTFLKPEVFHRLLEYVFGQFSFARDAELSLEADVRVTSKEHLDVLRKFGFNRISFGVQDFTKETQVAINRVQSAMETYNFVTLCRTMGFKSVNIDLVYGLPHQTAETFRRTLKTMIEIDPDRVALYNFAFLPSKMPFQRRIDENSLPDTNERFSILQAAIERFTENGYVYIGMDHFAKPEDELTIAQGEGTLQRNFMGFTTRAGTDLYAFGTSSISSLPALYVQNVKKLNQYEKMVSAGEFPVERGIELSRDDQIRRWVIMELMCNLRIDIPRFEATWKVDFHAYFQEEIDRLRPFIEDGLLDPNIVREIKVTDLGHIIVRPIAMVFDAYLKKPNQSKAMFSKTL